jgi:protein TonB
MNFSNEKSTGRNFTGITVVVILHILVAYAVISGLGKRMVAKLADPVETKIIEEVKPPPPKDLPPPPPPPEMKAPPPPFIPPVEVNVQQPPPPTPIASVSTAKPLTNDLPRPATPAPAAPPAPAAATGVKVNAVVDFSSCAKPDYPKSSLRNEETGTSTMSFLIGVDGHVVEAKVQKSSGFRDLDKAAINALSKCTFKPGTVDGKPEQSWAPVQYVWTLD